MITLFECGHSFHEHCFLENFGTISYPSLEDNLGKVATVLESKSVKCASVSKLPAGSKVRNAASRMLDMIWNTTGQDMLTIINTAVQRALDQRGGLQEDEIEEDLDPAHIKTRVVLALTDQEPFTQNLYPASPFVGDMLYREVYVSDVKKDHPPSPSCPYCHQAAELGELDENADSVQLIRARFRLTNLAYQCLRFPRSRQEDVQREQIAKFLRRRSEDNDVLAIENVDTWTLSDRGEHLFKEARIELREQAYFYATQHKPPHKELLPLLKLASFFENFKLKSEDQQFFFGTCPTLDWQWDYNPGADELRHSMLYFHLSPAGYCQDMEISMKDGETIKDDPPSVRIRRLLDFDTMITMD
ncbi:MAG: hypothetical protein Q9168_002738 [Polycauliona sp. 1 TL-2023]